MSHPYTGPNVFNVFDQADWYLHDAVARLSTLIEAAHLFGWRDLEKKLQEIQAQVRTAMSYRERRS